VSRPISRGLGTVVALLERHAALAPTTLLEHLQEQKPDQDWSSF
jgi:hypothetical protein